jgi:hypothetical protein
VAFGDFALEERFIVGPAVDAAAEAMDAADAGLVWLAPSARRRVFEARRVERVTTEPLLRTYKVPMKGGGTFSTFVISPYDSLDQPAERATYMDAVIGTFSSDRIDIQVKRQNTAAFLIEEHKRLERSERRKAAVK